MKYLEQHEVDKLLSTCKNYRDYLLIRTLWRSGCRVSEVLAVRGDDIDVKRGTLRVPALKLKRKGRYKYPVVDHGTLSMLADFSNGDSRRVFQISRQRAWQIVNETARRAGIRHIGCHALRHSFATL